jgi:hypothetical protein
MKETVVVRKNGLMISRKKAYQRSTNIFEIILSQSLVRFFWRFCRALANSNSFGFLFGLCVLAKTKCA